MIVGRYFHPMLAMNITNPADNVFTRLNEEVALEPKLDGIRCQLHKLDDKVWLISRGGEDITKKFPEVVQSTIDFNHNLILDGELLAFNRDGFLPFDDTNKKLKSGAGLAAFIGFDALYFDEVTYDLSFWRRRELLQKVPVNSFFRVIPQNVTSSPARLKDFYIKSIKSGYEGIMIKDLEAGYYFGRTWLMRKLKPIRTMDVKVVSVENGKLDYLVYGVAIVQGLIAKVTTKEKLTIGEIVEIRYDKFIEAKDYPLEKCLRFATFVRRREDKILPDSSEPKTK
jgi:DNA ligase-1